MVTTDTGHGIDMCDQTTHGAAVAEQDMIVATVTFQPLNKKQIKHENILDHSAFSET